MSTDRVAEVRHFCVGVNTPTMGTARCNCGALLTHDDWYRHKRTGYVPGAPS